MNLEKIYVGMEVKNYPEMCILLGEEILAGNSKRAQNNNWKRFFRWEKKGQKFIIAEIYDKPFPERVRSDEIYSEHVMTVLSYRLKDERGFAGTFSTTQLLRMCGFVSPDWDDSEMLKKLASFRGYTYGEVKYHYCDLDTHVRQYCTTALMRSLDSLSKRNMLHWEKKLLITKEGVEHEATAEEEEKYKKAERALKKEMGIVHLSVYNRDLFYSRLKKALYAKYKWDKAYSLHEIGLTGEKGEVCVSQQLI